MTPSTTEARAELSDGIATTLADAEGCFPDEWCYVLADSILDVLLASPALLLAMGGEQVGWARQWGDDEPPELSVLDPDAEGHAEDIADSCLDAVWVFSGVSE